jgi:hypothetical protein
MNNLLIYAMAFYVFYIWCLAIYMFRSRVRAIKIDKLPFKYFKTYNGVNQPSEQVIVIGRHYDNQFQVPILFLITCAVCLAMKSVDLFTVILAWFFVVSRLIHSYIHLGSNRIQFRVTAFAAGWIAVLLMWMQIVYLSL